MPSSSPTRGGKRKSTGSALDDAAKKKKKKSGSKMGQKSPARSTSARAPTAARSKSPPRTTAVLKNSSPSRSSKPKEKDETLLTIPPPPQSPVWSVVAVRSSPSSSERLREILATMSKYGLADMLGDSKKLPKSIADSLKSGDKQLTDMTRPERLRLLLLDLGTTFIKLGQVLSTRSDLVGPEMAEELAKLQADTPADAPDVVRATIEAELGGPPEELFSEFDSEAMASASIGQVHCAELMDGTPVVVKVQHAGIEHVILNDFEILAKLATLAERYSSELRLYNPTKLCDNFRRDLLRELDFGRECRSLQAFHKNFEDDDMVVIPMPYPELSSRRVMTMDRINGKSVKHTDALEEDGHDLQDIAERGANIFVKMIFDHRFYHADPHPGNIFVLEDGEICLLDCGMTGTLNDRLRDDIEELLSAALDGDGERLTDAVMSLATVPRDFNREAFEGDVAVFLDEYIDMPIDQWDFSAVIEDLTAIIRQHRIQLPPSVSLLLRMLVELEGTARLLSPNFSLVGLLQPYMQKAFFRKFDPQRMVRTLARNARDWERLMIKMPRELSDLLKRAREGSLTGHLHHRGLDSTINRMIYGILTSSLILGSSQLWSREIEPLIWGQSVPGVACAAGAAVLSFRLLRAIENVGGLEEVEV